MDDKEVEQRQYGHVARYRTQDKFGAYTSPGDYVFWFAGQLVDPDLVVFSDWAAAADDDRGHCSGQGVLITTDTVYHLVFTGVVSDLGDPRSGGFGQVSTHAYRRSDVQSILWSVDRLDPDDLRTNVEAGIVQVAFSHGAVLKLPFARRLRTDTLAFFRELYAATLG
ncbi:MAG TPA: hypothetical protein VJ851_19360 [Jatrophihabitans sp.]|nr:hypothetical protein [Jatrophihabitans sp.]